MIWALCAAVCILAFPIVVDFVSAVNAQPCPSGPNCYPWGSEGPAAEYWYYESKEVYLARSAVLIGLPLIVLSVLIVTRGQRRTEYRIFALVGLVGWLAFALI